MIEYRLNEDGILVEVNSELENGVPEMTLENQELSQLPVEGGFWTKFKGFLFQEVNLKEFLFQEVDLGRSFNFFKLELTDYERKVFKEVRDFWMQDVTQPFSFK